MGGTLLRFLLLFASCGVASSIPVFTKCLDCTIASPGIIVGWHNVPIVPSTKKPCHGVMGRGWEGVQHGAGRGSLCAFTWHIAPGLSGCIWSYFSYPVLWILTHTAPVPPVVRPPLSSPSFLCLASWPLSLLGLSPSAGLSDFKQRRRARMLEEAFKILSMKLCALSMAGSRAHGIAHDLRGHQGHPLSLDMFAFLLELFRVLCTAKLKVLFGMYWIR